MDGAGHMTPDEFRRCGAALIERIARYMEEDRALPGPLTRGARIGPRAPAPHRARAVASRSPTCCVTSTESSCPDSRTGSRRTFFAYFPANASGPAILGDLLSSGLGVQGMLWATSPACTELETHVLDWLVDLLGLPQRFRSSTAGGGVIQDSASSSTLTALLAARERASGGAINEHRAGRGSPRQRLTVYTSRHAHSSIEKAVKIAGLGRDNLRLVDTDGRHAMRVDALEAAIAADRDTGAIPAMVCATVGTTSSGAVDPVRAIGALCRREQIWLHVDAAHAGSATICPEHRGLIDGAELAGQLHVQPAQVVAHQLRLQLLLGCRPRRADRRAERPSRIPAQPRDRLGRGHRLPRLARAARPALPRPQALVRHPPLRSGGLARPRPHEHRACRVVRRAGGAERPVRSGRAVVGRAGVLPPSRGRRVQRRP